MTTHEVSAHTTEQNTKHRQDTLRPVVPMTGGSRWIPLPKKASEQDRTAVHESNKISTVGQLMIREYRMQIMVNTAVAKYLPQLHRQQTIARLVNILLNNQMKRRIWKWWAFVKVVATYDPAFVQSYSGKDYVAIGWRTRRSPPTTEQHSDYKDHDNFVYYGFP